jgi:hypothetical protein
MGKSAALPSGDSWLFSPWDKYRYLSIYQLSDLSRMINLRLDLISLMVHAMTEISQSQLTLIDNIDLCNPNIFRLPGSIRVTNGKEIHLTICRL